MLTNLMITKWEGANSKDQRVRDSTNGSNFLLNGNRINGLEVRDTTKSKLMFTDSLRNPREKASYIEAVESVATIQTEIDKTWQSMFAPLYFYTDNDATKATFLRRVNVETISYVYPDPALTSGRSWVVYYESDKRMELLCSYSIKQVQALVDSGSLTTTAG